jgi:hypothetical protein
MLNLNAQVQRAVEGMSIIRENIIQYSEFTFFRDWTTVATFKSGIGETTTFYPITFSVPDKNIKLYGLQLDALVKPQMSATTYAVGGGVPGAAVINKDFLSRSIFIDKADVLLFIDFLEKQVVPNLKTTYKKQSKEYVFKTKEMFFSFLIDEKTARITMHLTDYGPNGDGNWAGQQIEFWTEAKVENIPDLVEKLKSFSKSMK